MKTKPFNLEEALKGAKVVTRDGGEVKELTKFENLKDYPLVGVLDTELKTWTTEGKYSAYDLGQSYLDLFLAVEPIRIYKNVYRSIDGGIELGASHKTKEQAVKQGSDAKDYIKTIEITDEPE